MALTPKQQARLNTLFTQHTTLSASIKVLEGKKAEISGELLKLTEDAGGELATSQYKAKVVVTTRETLSEELLLKHGVKPTIIAKSKVSTTHKPYVKVSVLGDAGGAQ